MGGRTSARLQEADVPPLGTGVTTAHPGPGDLDETEERDHQHADRTYADHDDQHDALLRRDQQLVVGSAVRCQLSPPMSS